MSKKKKKDNDIVVTFLGSSVRQVTGSCIKILYKNDKLENNIRFLECGLPQSSKTPLNQYNDMERMSNAVKGGGLNNHEKYKNINAVLSHVH